MPIWKDLPIATAVPIWKDLPIATAVPIWKDGQINEHRDRGRDTAKRGEGCGRGGVWASLQVRVGGRGIVSPRFESWDGGWFGSPGCHPT